MQSGVCESVGYCIFSISVLSGIKQVNVELEPGFQAAQQKRDNGKNFYRICKSGKTSYRHSYEYSKGIKCITQHTHMYTYTLINNKL